MQEETRLAQIIAIAKQIWPRTWRIIQITIYYTFRFIKNAVLYMINQFRNT